MTKDEIIEYLKSQIESQERWGTMQGTSWHLEEGVLISGEEALFILHLLSVDSPINTTGIHIQLPPGAEVVSITQMQPGPPVEIAVIKIN